jgi:hypothetical protein
LKAVENTPALVTSSSIAPVHRGVAASSKTKQAFAVIFMLGSVIALLTSFSAVDGWSTCSYIQENGHGRKGRSELRRNRKQAREFELPERE